MHGFHALVLLGKDGDELKPITGCFGFLLFGGVLHDEVDQGRPGWLFWQTREAYREGHRVQIPLDAVHIGKVIHCRNGYGTE